MTPAEALVDGRIAAGLRAEEIEARRRIYGHNEVVEHRTSPLIRLAARFWGPSAWMLEAIAILSWWTGRRADLTVALLLLIVNAVVSFTQELRAEGVVETLRRRLTVQARVRRDGQWLVIPARELVPDDVVRLRQGDLVPADVEILDGTLTVDQAVLTGESLDSVKAPHATVYSGSRVRRGEATGRVTQTGARTYFGRTVELVQVARPRLHAEDIVARLVRWLSAIVGFMLVVFATVALVRGVPLADLLPLTLALLLGAVPVALPVMFTVSMAVGARELGKHGVLVTRLSAVEDAAAMDALCIDKTGTITQNRLTLAGVIPASGYTARDVLMLGACASQEADQDPIDLAVLAGARAAAVLEGLRIRTIQFVPFDATRRRTEATVELDGATFVAIKGAVDTVAALCAPATSLGADLERQAQEHATRGYRALAVARAVKGAAPELAGLVMLHDPPRPDAAGLIRALADAGISVKMLTGDALPIATEVARRVGLAHVRSVAGIESGTAIDAAALDPAAGGLAEVFPEDKFRVVKALQAAGHVTGMTGDGVNDSPALRQAEVGIAVSAATDVAKGAASVVLTTEGLSGIVVLVHEGRIVAQRVLTWIINKVSRTILKSAYVAIAFFLTGRFAISALGLIVVVLLTDFVIIALATDRARGASAHPQTWNLAVPVAVGGVTGALLLAEALGALALGWHLFDLGARQQELQTFSFQLLLYFSLFSVVSVRERKRFWASRPSRPLVIALACDAVLGVALCHVGLQGLTPVPASVTVFVVGGAMIASLIVNDWVKAALFRRADARAT